MELSAARTWLAKETHTVCVTVSLAGHGAHVVILKVALPITMQGPQESAF